MSMKVQWVPRGAGERSLHWALDVQSEAALARYGVVHELTANEPVFEKGRPSEALYLVLEGDVSVVKGGQVIAHIGPNHSFGEMGLLLGRPRAAEVRAVSDARVLELSRTDIERMMEKEPVWAARLYRVLAECLAEYLSQATGS
jgi:CRP-like cAMP-binding protein